MGKCTPEVGSLPSLSTSQPHRCPCGCAGDFLLPRGGVGILSSVGKSVVLMAFFFF